MCRLIVLFLPLVLLGGIVVVAQRVEVPTPPNQETRPSIVAPPTQQTQSQKRMREGTVFKNKLVIFRQIGNRTVLYTVEENQRFVCLENLALERILTAAQEKPERQFWKIDGNYTEFRGENFVLIRRAVIAPNPETSSSTTP